jgi:hypothetical protein
LAWAVFAQLPMCALAFYGVRQPVDAWLREWLGAGTEAYRFARVFYAPVTEELAKLWPLLLLSFRQRINTGSMTRAGVALGLGFGVGEMWMVAGLVANDPQVAGLPFIKGGQVNTLWKTVEPAEGRYDFSDVDQQLAELNRRGRVATARAMLMRCRWPPENSCG